MFLIFFFFDARLILVFCLLYREKSLATYKKIMIVHGNQVTEYRDGSEPVISKVDEHADRLDRDQ